MALRSVVFTVVAMLVAVAESDVREKVSKEFCDRVCQCNAFDPVHKRIPSGYLISPGMGTYKLYLDTQTWKEANATCTRDGGYLAIPDTKEELDILMKLRYGVKDLHIGFTNYFTEKEFQTSIGTPMSEFQEGLWYSGYPKTYNNRNAVLLYQNGKIWDYRNDQKYPFICELSHA